MLKVHITLCLIVVEIHVLSDIEEKSDNFDSESEPESLANDFTHRLTDIQKKQTYFNASLPEPNLKLTLTLTI